MPDEPIPYDTGPWERLRERLRSGLPTPEVQVDLGQVASSGGYIATNTDYERWVRSTRGLWRESAQASLNRVPMEASPTEGLHPMAQPASNPVSRKAWIIASVRRLDGLLRMVRWPARRSFSHIVWIGNQKIEDCALSSTRTTCRSPVVQFMIPCPERDFIGLEEDLRSRGIT
jgi:hypothetical protein